MDAGLSVNAAVVLVCVLAGALGLRRRDNPLRAEVLALVTCATVVATWPLLVAIGRSLGGEPGGADLSQAWSWVLLAMTALASASAVYLVLAPARRPRTEPLGPPGVLDSLVVAQMAIELDRTTAASQAIQAAIASVSSDADAVGSGRRIPRRVAS
jgi:hypothetical protein